MQTETLQGTIVAVSTILGDVGSERQKASVWMRRRGCKRRNTRTRAEQGEDYED